MEVSLDTLDDISRNLFEIEQLAECIYNIDAKTEFPEQTINGIKHLADIIRKDAAKINENL